MVSDQRAQRTPGLATLTYKALIVYMKLPKRYITTTTTICIIAQLECTELVYLIYANRDSSLRTETS